MTYEFIYEFMYMKNIVKSYLKSCVPRFQMSVRMRGRRAVAHSQVLAQATRRWPPSTRGPPASSTHDPGPEPPSAGQQHRRATRSGAAHAGRRHRRHRPVTWAHPARSRADLGPDVPARPGLGWEDICYHFLHMLTFNTYLINRRFATLHFKT